MKVKMRITKDVAVACIMLHLYFENGTIKPLNAKVFRELCGGYLFSYGQQKIDDHQDDYDQYWELANKIVDKYYYE
tara:strand:+ start:196 stop:423 length:228 start_codon:yes stop_codon:yes gene_type:complete